VDLATRRRTEGSPRDLRGFGSCERQFWRREPTEPKPMSTLSIEKSRKLESAAPKKGSAKSNAPWRRKVTSATVIAKKPVCTKNHIRIAEAMESVKLAQ
jgi:hypothetical protein